ncbi:MAG: MBL fold metallo-hydrolase [Verrucomicrobia bacterium]|nr:MBL fold metallo-hydrolase [Verrucomicrobiota bacterium]
MGTFVKFWGTRGSIPTPASWTRVYGGNTSCVEVRFDDTVFICDAGSGIRALGKDLLARKPGPDELHLLLTHTHWDHIQGFPFFPPAYVPKTRIRIYGPSEGDDSRYQLLSGQMSSDYFPVSFGELGAKITSDFLPDGRKEIDGVQVRSFPLNHPGGCCGYSFEKNGAKIVYATDNELPIQPGEKFPDPRHEGKLRAVPAALVEAARGADLLITDAQYDEAQYQSKRGWGHSSCFSATDFALRAEARQLALFHHDPESTDRELDAKVASCQKRAARRGSTLVVFAAREGVELKF